MKNMTMKSVVANVKENEMSSQSGLGGAGLLRVPPSKQFDTPVSPLSIWYCFSSCNTLIQPSSWITSLC